MVFRPLGVRVLAVLVWVALVVYVVLLVRQDTTEAALRFAPVAALVALVVYAVFWRPAVRVDDEGVRVTNVLREVAVPYARLDALDTRYALRLESGDRTVTAWAAPAPGRTSAMSLSRRDATAAALLGADLDQGVTASAAPNTDSGAAALMVRVRWERWLAREQGQAASDGAGDDRAVTSTWDVPLTTAALVLVVLTAVAVLL